MSLEKIDDIALIMSTGLVAAFAIRDSMKNDKGCGKWHPGLSYILWSLSKNIEELRREVQNMKDTDVKSPELSARGASDK